MPLVHNGHLLYKFTITRLGDTADLPNTQKQAGEPAKVGKLRNIIKTHLRWKDTQRLKVKDGKIYFIQMVTTTKKLG